MPAPEDASVVSDPIVTERQLQYLDDESFILTTAETVSNPAVVVSVRCKESSHYIKELVGLFEEGSV